MAAVSQALVDFANHVRPPAAPGVEIIRTERYQITLLPDFPIPGPNSVSYVRCAPGAADELISEVRSIVAERRLPVMWVLDPETEPPDFAERLVAHGALADPHARQVAVMVLPVEATVAPPSIPGFEIHDALADLKTFRSADEVGAEAFGSRNLGEDPDQVEAQERRRVNQLAAGTRRLLLATVDGEPAGSAGMTLFVPDGAIINGGGVRPRFRGRGVYRALVAARLELARDAGVAGLTVWGNEMSGPILSGLGFAAVGWRRFYLDTTSA